MTPENLLPRVQVNIPFSFLFAGYLERFLARGLHPEIGLDAGSLSRYRPATFRAIAQAFQRAHRRLTLHAPFQDLSPGALDEMVLTASRRRLRQAFHLLPIFQPLAVVCHLGYEARHYRHDLDTWLTRAAATFRELTAMAHNYGVTVMVENVYETEPELFLALLDRVQTHNLKVCLDVGHLLAFGGGDFERWLHTLWPVIGQLHLHDNRGQDDDHQALGRGLVPLAYVLNFLADKNQRPIITLEPHQEGSLTPSLSHLASLWPWD